MSQTSIQEIRTLKVGRYIVIDNEPCKLVEYVTSKPGKHGEAKARMVAIGLFDGQKRSLVHPVKHKVHVPQVDRRKAQILANLGSQVQQLTVQNLSASVHIRHLNESNVEQAMQSPEVFRAQNFKKQLTVNGSLKLELLPYALVCIDRAGQ